MISTDPYSVSRWWQLDKKGVMYGNHLLQWQSAFGWKNHPQLLWCMHCLRTSAKNVDPHGGIPFAIDCVFDAKKSIPCACARAETRPEIWGRDGLVEQGLGRTNGVGL
jgi:hypothetical protein